LNPWEKVLRGTGQYQKAKQKKPSANARDIVEMETFQVDWNQLRHKATPTRKAARPSGELLARKAGPAVLMPSSADDQRRWQARIGTNNRRTVKGRDHRNRHTVRTAASFHLIDVEKHF
jgi:hypothetical protein